MKVDDMQRYFVAPAQFTETTVTISMDDAHHIVRVMRMKEGDQVIVSDGASRTVLAAIRTLDQQQVELDIIEQLPLLAEASWRVTIAQALPKSDKMELIVQKCTEIGAASFIPFESERVIVQYDRKKEAKRVERWSKIAKEAAEQSHRNQIPVVHEPLSWKQLLASFEQYQLVLFCYEKADAIEQGIHLRAVLQQFKATMPENCIAPNILLIAGPEGGFSTREAEEAERAGAVLTGLGKRILRAETAGIVGLTCLLYESGEMGGV